MEEKEGEKEEEEEEKQKEKEEEKEKEKENEKIPSTRMDQNSERRRGLVEWRTSLMALTHTALSLGRVTTEP